MPEPSIEQLQALIAALQKQLAAVQTGSGGQAVGRDNVAAGERGVAVGRDFIGNIYQGTPPDNDAEAIAIYRRMLVLSCRQLPLRGVHVGASDPTSGEQQMNLDQVYIGLDTTSKYLPEDETWPEEDYPRTERLSRESGLEREKSRPLPTLLATALNRRMVLLGDPGSGKSTFFNHLSLCLALHGLEPAEDWCNRLPGWPKVEASLLPLPVVLRDFARTIPAKPPAADANSLWSFITERLGKQQLALVARPLEQALEAGRAIVLLDGLDEIATPPHRKFVREAVQQFAERYGRSRFVVTCRTLSYQERAWKLQFKDARGKESEFPAFILAPFNEQQIDRFLAAWYGDLARQGNVKPEDTAILTRNLQTALRRPDLWQLAANPLLLTVMALVHTHKGRLPEARALLYEDTVDILLWRWDEIRLVGEGGISGLRQLLLETGRSDVDLKRTLWRLAFEAHRAGGHEERLADIGELALQTALAELHPDKNREWAWQVIQTIRNRAGLLLERLPHTYTFPHRTFQEYLAGSHLASQARFAQESAKLVEAGAFWREVILLAVGRLVYLSGDTDKPLALVGELCPQQASTTPLGWQKAWLAGEVLGEMGLPRVHEGALGRDLLERVQGRLTALLEAGALTPVERANAGAVLGRLGDPRPGVGLKDGLPDIFFEEPTLPAGPFTLAENGQKVQIRQPYRISRYPVTVEQYRAFVAAGGYENERWWTPEGLKWKLTNAITGPEDYDPKFQTPNHPRVGVSWYEATAFCAWFTEAWRKRGPHRAGQVVRLPHEAEWEQAARWNAQDGKADDRYFPWGGGKADADLARRCNMGETGIGATCAVGLFPNGNAGCGAADLAGNVWEWSENLYDEKDKKYRGLRGGSWLFVLPAYLSCSCRRYGAPEVRVNFIGFRVVCAGVSAR
jgi:formylglycine-generating enzyme required for sulfatase activity